MTMLLERPASGSSPDTDANESAQDLRTEYLMCRRSVLGHAWEPYQDNEKPAPSFGTRFSVRCSRCTTQRHYLLGFNGERLGKEYVYPEGYKLVGDHTSEEFWQEVLVREADGRLVVKAKRIRGTRVQVPA